nr:hypothetical protein [Micromonospora sp. DSM 115978]
TTSLALCLLSLAMAVTFAADLGGDGRSSAARVAVVVLLVPAYALFTWRGWVLWTARRQARRADAGAEVDVDADAEVS